MQGILGDISRGYVYTHSLSQSAAHIHVKISASFVQHAIQIPGQNTGHKSAQTLGKKLYNPGFVLPVIDIYGRNLRRGYRRPKIDRKSVV